jgi:positive phototaxis protein PixI
MLDLSSRELDKQAERAVGELFLRFKLQSNLMAALRLEVVQEVLSIPADHLTPIPFMPECTFGLLNQRSRIIWAVDLPQIMGLSHIDRNRQQYNIAIIKTGNNTIATVVDEIKGVFRFPQELVQTNVESLPPNLVSYLQGCIVQEEEILMLLEPNSIINSPMLGVDLSLLARSASNY